MSWSRKALVAGCVLAGGVVGGACLLICGSIAVEEYGTDKKHYANLLRSTSPQPSGAIAGVRDWPELGNKW